MEEGAERITSQSAPKAAHDFNNVGTAPFNHFPHAPQTPIDRFATLRPQQEQFGFEMYGNAETIRSVNVGRIARFPCSSPQLSAFTQPGFAAPAVPVVDQAFTLTDTGKCWLLLAARRNDVAAMEDATTDQLDTTTEDIRSEQLKRIQQGPVPVELLLDAKLGASSSDADEGSRQPQSQQ